MTGDGLIDKVIAFTESVAANDGHNAQRRLRLLYYAQGVLEEVWNYKAWRFLYKTGTVTINASGVGVLPTDFGQFGAKGGMFHNTTGEPLIEDVDAKELYARYLRGERNETDFAIFGYDTTTSKPQVQFLQVSATVKILYCRHVPTLADNDTDQLPIPLDYHESVLVNGTIAKARASKGDVRDFRSAYLIGLEAMCRKEAPMQGNAQTFPLVRQGW